LKQAKFKKDFDIGTTWNDEQAGHTTYLAGSIYARGIQEAPGHVAAARAEYREVSRAWHSWLGFAASTNTATTTAATVATTPTAAPTTVAPTTVPSVKRKALSEVLVNQPAKRGWTSKEL